VLELPEPVIPQRYGRNAAPGDSSHKGCSARLRTRRGRFPERAIIRWASLVAPAACGRSGVDGRCRAAGADSPLTVAWGRWGNVRRRDPATMAWPAPSAVLAQSSRVEGSEPHRT